MSLSVKRLKFLNRQNIGIAVSLGVLVYGCGGSSGGGGGGGGGGGKQTTDLEAKNVADEAAALNWIKNGDYFRAKLSSDYPNGSKGQVYEGEYNMTGSKNGISPTITIRAAYTSTELYMQLDWDDVSKTHNLNRRRFLFNGPNEAGTGIVEGWSSQLNDDKFALAFDIDHAADGTGTFADKGCTVGCHGSMNPLSGKMDIWHYKTARSNPLGYVNDQVSDPAGRVNDSGDPIEVRNWKVSGNIAAGPGFYYDPVSGNQTVNLPEPSEGTATLDPALFLLKGNMKPFVGDADAGDTLFQNKCSGCHSPISNWKDRFAARGLNQTDAQLKSFLSGDSHPGAGATTGFSATDWDNILARIRAFTGVPGYYLQTPSGSNADLIVMNSKTVYNPATGHYTVIVKRKLVTGNSDDVQFDLGVTKSYVFGVAVMDDDGKNHAGSPHQFLKFL